MEPAARRLINRAARHRQRLRRYYLRTYPELLPWQINFLEHSYYRGVPAHDWRALTRVDARPHKHDTRFT